MKQLPILGVTLGEPAGVGIEVALKAFGQGMDAPLARLLMIGEVENVKTQLHFAGERATPHFIRDPAEALWEAKTLNVLDMGTLPAVLPAGKLSAKGGEAAFRALERGIVLAQQGVIDGIVTAPINKEALNLAGHKFDGHTEILGHFCGKLPTYMLLSSRNLNIVHVSTHCSLRQACDRAQKPRVLATIRALHAHLKLMGIPVPEIAVAGLNPHAGEHGLFGHEEQDHIIPAIEQARAEGIRAEGPVPPDSLYLRAYRGASRVVQDRPRGDEEGRPSPVPQRPVRVDRAGWRPDWQVDPQPRRRLPHGRPGRQQAMEEHPGGAPEDVRVVRVGVGRRHAVQR